MCFYTHSDRLKSCDLAARKACALRRIVISKRQFGSRGVNENFIGNLLAVVRSRNRTAELSDASSRR